MNPTLKVHGPVVRPVNEQPPGERRDNLVSLFNDVVLPQRRRLLQARDHTWQSAHVDDDGYLAELIAAFVLGVPGTLRKGVSTSTGDLADGTEVKKGFRLDPNIDFMLDARLKQAGTKWVLDVDSLPPELLLADIVGQLNANACSVQVVRDSKHGLIGERMFRTAGKKALVHGAKRTSATLRVSDVPDGAREERLLVCVRQERGHINFGNKTRAKLDQIIRSGPVLVFYQHDVRGRFSVAVIRVHMGPKETQRYLDELYGDNKKAVQIQPYLFPDNVRDKLYANSPHSVRDGLQGHLLAYGVETPSGFEFLHWELESPPRVRDAEALLTSAARPDACPPFRHAPISLDWADLAARREFAGEFFDQAIVGYSRGLSPYCAMASSTRNIGFGNLSQHLASICTGLRGTRSGARGKDLVEPDFVTPSEVKLATGQRGDTMGTEDMPRLTLGWDHEKMLEWKRLIAVRLVEVNTAEGPRWHAMVQAPTQETMKHFRKQVAAYFDGRVYTASGGLQYHAREYPHDEYGTKGHRLSFACVGDFVEGRPARFPQKMPDW